MIDSCEFATAWPCKRCGATIFFDTASAHICSTMSEGGMLSEETLGRWQEWKKEGIFEDDLVASLWACLDEIERRRVYNANLKAQLTEAQEEANNNRRGEEEQERLYNAAMDKVQVLVAQLKAVKADSQAGERARLEKDIRLVCPWCSKGIKRSEERFHDAGNYCPATPLRRELEEVLDAESERS